MELITPESLAKNAAARWASSYRRNGKWYFMKRESSGDIHVRLVELGAAPTPEQVEAVIGNGSWTKTECDDCDAANVPVVRYGIEDYDTACADVCRSCLSGGLELSK